MADHNTAIPNVCIGPIADQSASDLLSDCDMISMTATRRINLVAYNFSTAERVEDNIAASRDILDRICNHLHRFDGWMHGQFFQAASSEGIGALVLPDVGPVAAMLAELKAVDVRGANTNY